MLKLGDVRMDEYIFHLGKAWIWGKAEDGLLGAEFVPLEDMLKFSDKNKFMYKQKGLHNNYLQTYFCSIFQDTWPSGKITNNHSYVFNANQIAIKVCPYQYVLTPRVIIIIVIYWHN